MSSEESSGIYDETIEAAVSLVDDKPGHAFDIILARKNSGIVLGRVELEQPFDLSKAIAETRSEFVKFFGEESFQIKLIDMFIGLIAPDALLSELDGDELSGRLGATLKMLEPHLLRAVRMDTSNEGAFMSTIAAVLRERRLRDQIVGFEYGID